MTRPSRCWIIGAGGHARVVIHVLRQIPETVILGCLEHDASLWGGHCGGISVMGPEEEHLDRDDKSVECIVGVGSTGVLAPRKKIYEKLKQWGFSVMPVVAPSAHVSESAQIAEGVQILTRAVVHPQAVLGANVVVNTGAILEHEVQLGAHAFVAPGAVVCGNVVAGEAVFIGAGAVIKQGVRIGDGAVIGAGAVVVRDVPPAATMTGVPARRRENVP